MTKWKKTFCDAFSPLGRHWTKVTFMLIQVHMRKGEEKPTILNLLNFSGWSDFLF